MKKELRGFGNIILETFTLATMFIVVIGAIHDKSKTLFISNSNEKINLVIA